MCVCVCLHLSLSICLSLRLSISLSLSHSLSLSLSLSLSHTHTLSLSFLHRSFSFCVCVNFTFASLHCLQQHRKQVHQTNAIRRVQQTVKPKGLGKKFETLSRKLKNKIMTFKTYSHSHKYTNIHIFGHIFIRPSKKSLF